MNNPIAGSLDRSQPDGASDPPAGDLRTLREEWIHDFRNALGNTTIAASAARYEIDHGKYQRIDALMRQIEDSCERCLRLLGTMPT